ncbi:MAG: hypothetical protein LBD06_06895 [Candidatus Accumulibacter sp.]|nr:hypothetical protein [Accumulibacter sp.]
MSHFPIPAPAFDGRSRAVEIGAVFAWLRLGWNLFMAAPVAWVVSMLLMIVAFVALTIVPLLGPLLVCLLLPVLVAGMLAMCRKAASGETPGLSDLTVGFATRTTPLILLGLIFMAAMLVIHVVMLLLLGGSVAGGLLLPNAVGIGILLGGSLATLLLSSLLIIPLWMAMWFAPALILFNGVPPVEACKISLVACLKNILPFLILGLIVFVLIFFAALPAGLGFLVLLPVLAGTAHASYQDIFVAH